MQPKTLLIALSVLAISSCSTAYKTGQTPDDVYFSPAPAYKDYVRSENKENNTVYNTDVYNTEDREIRRRINNRRYRRYDDRYNYPYGNNNGYNNYPPVYTDPKTTNTNSSQPRKYNLGVYKNTPPSNTTTNTDPKLGTQQNTGTTSTPVRKFDNTSNNGSGVGNFIRKVLSGSGNEGSNNSSSQNNSNSNSSSNNTKSSNNNSNTNSSNSNSSNVPVRKFN